MAGYLAPFANNHKNEANSIVSHLRALRAIEPSSLDVDERKYNEQQDDAAMKMQWNGGRCPKRRRKKKTRIPIQLRSAESSFFEMGMWAVRAMVIVIESCSLFTMQPIPTGQTTVNYLPPLIVCILILFFVARKNCCLATMCFSVRSLTIVITCHNIVHWCVRITFVAKWFFLMTILMLRSVLCWLNIHQVYEWHQIWQINFVTN